MNTKINYFYRDASNYKAVPEEDVIIAGDLTMDDLVPHTRVDNKFIPGDIGLPELQSQLEGYPGDDDHIWHELLSLELTEKNPTVEITAGEIKNCLKTIDKEGWNESAAYKRPAPENQTKKVEQLRELVLRIYDNLDHVTVEKKIAPEELVA